MNITVNLPEALQEQLDRIERSLANTASHGTGAKYLPQHKLAEFFGVSLSTMKGILARARSAGAVRVLVPPAESGRDGSRLYHVADLEAFLAERREK